MTQVHGPEPEAPAKRKNGTGNHLWKLWRERGTPKRTTRLSLFGQAARALYPHSIYDYPGDLAGVLALLKSRASRGAVRKWMSGERRVPKWALELIIVALDRRIAHMKHWRDIAKKEAGL